MLSDRRFLWAGLLWSCTGVEIRQIRGFEALSIHSGSVAPMQVGGDVRDRKVCCRETRLPPEPATPLFYDRKPAWLWCGDFIMGTFSCFFFRLSSRVNSLPQLFYLSQNDQLCFFTPPLPPPPPRTLPMKSLVIP